MSIDQIYPILNQLKNYYGDKNYQDIFEKLYDTAIAGMFYGAGENVSNSGEINSLNYIKNKLVQGPKTFFDVGANIGKFSGALYSIFDGFCCHCFEPSRVTFIKLQNNIGKYSNIFLNNFGLGEKEENLILYYDYPESGLASVYKRELSFRNIHMNMKEEIKLRTVDSYCKENSIDKIDILKIDAEGHEIPILKGSLEMINKGAVKFIQFEFGGCNIDSRTYFRDFWFLLSDKYTIYRILENGFKDISNYKETLEIFTTVNFLAELR